MQITYKHKTPPLGQRQKFIYSTDGDVLTVKQGELEETFDFTVEFTDGEFDITVNTLTENPIIKATKVNGEVILILRQYESITENLERQRKGEINNG